MFLSRSSDFSTKIVTFSYKNVNWQIFFKKTLSFPEKVENFYCDFTISLIKSTDFYMKIERVLQKNLNHQMFLSRPSDFSTKIVTFSYKNH